MLPVQKELAMEKYSFMTSRKYTVFARVSLIKMLFDCIEQDTANNQTSVFSVLSNFASGNIDE